MIGVCAELVKFIQAAHLHDCVCECRASMGRFVIRKREPKPLCRGVTPVSSVIRHPLETARLPRPCHLPWLSVSAPTTSPFLADADFSRSLILILFPTICDIKNNWLPPTGASDSETGNQGLAQLLSSQGRAGQQRSLGGEREGRRGRGAGGTGTHRSVNQSFLLRLPAW